VADLPIACSLSPAALTARRESLLNTLAHRATARTELPNGYRLQFESGGDLLALTAQVIDAERQCCRFLQFSLTVEADEGPVTLDLTGPPGTRDFLASLFDQP